MEVDKKLIDEICRKLTDEGRLIEGGWMSLRLLTIPQDAPLVQLHEMRYSFFAGAQHLFASIMGILEPGAEPTEKDLQRLTTISNELERFVAEVKKGTVQ